MPRAGECSVLGGESVASWTRRSIVWHLKGISSVFKVHFANRIQWPALSPGSVWLMGYVPDIPESWMWVIPWQLWWAWRDQGQLNHNDLLLLAQCLAQIFIFNYLKKVRLNKQALSKWRPVCWPGKNTLKGNLIRTFLFLKQEIKSHLFICVYMWGWECMSWCPYRGHTCHSALMEVSHVMVPYRGHKCHSAHMEVMHVMVPL